MVLDEEVFLRDDFYSFGHGGSLTLGGGEGFLGTGGGHRQKEEIYGKSLVKVLKNYKRNGDEWMGRSLGKRGLCFQKKAGVHVFE